MSALPIPAAPAGMPTLAGRIDHAAQVHDVLVLSWEQRTCRRMQATLAGGAAVTVALPDGAALRHGDLLRGDDGRVVRVVAAPEPTYALRCADPLVLSRCAHDLGRRHVRFQVCGWGLRLRADPLLRPSLLALGAQLAEELAVFDADAGPFGQLRAAPAPLPL